MKIIDISTKLSDKTVRYRGDPRTKIKTVKDGRFRTSTISTCLHTGTHVDAPSHIIKDGKTVDEVPLDCLIGTARVCEVERGAVEAETLRRCRLRPGDIILLKSRKTKITPRITSYLTHDAAEYLISAGVKSVGTDQLSVDSEGSDIVHTILLGRGIPIMESLELRHARPGRYTLICLPLKVVGAEAAPARCVLLCR